MSRLVQSIANASIDDATLQVALIGNPNTGKSTAFNRLTGIRQRTGNYPGVTVERRYGTCSLDADHNATIVDLPGTYSLAAASADERVVVDVLSGHIPGTRLPDVAVCVADATNLMRHLFLVSQIAETGVSVVLAVNLMDAAESQGISIDAKLLSERLNIPVVPMCASRGRGLDELRAAILKAHQQPTKMNNLQWPQAVHEATEYLRQSLAAEKARDLTPPELLRLLFDQDSAIADRIGWSAAQHRMHVDQARTMLHEANLDPDTVEPMLRYAFLAEIMENVVTHPTVRRATGGESIDRLLTHRFWGLIVFAALMYGVFWTIYTGAGPMMDAIDGTFGWLGEIVGTQLESWPMIQSLVVDGLIAGVGGVVIFLPQILILFFFISLLEDTGYMARAAYLMDKLFSWCGLNGKSFVPLLSSFACAIPGVMGARTIDNPRSRLTTILIAPLMSCSARLPVYVLLIGAFIEPKYGSAIAAAVLFGMHLLGLVIALPFALLFNRVIFKVKRSPFILEMPSYRVPDLRDALWRMWNRGKDFLMTAGTVILAMSIVIWALSYFPRGEEVAEHEQTVFITEYAAAHELSPQRVGELIEAGNEEVTGELDAHIEGAYLEQSYLGRMGKAVQPLFAPAGFDWKTTVGVLASFPAREVIISTLGITYNLGADVDESSEGLIGSMKSAHWPDGSPVFTIPVALAVMVFFALCMQCMATLAVMGREAGWGWAAFGFTYMTVLAWFGAVFTYQVGTWIGNMA
ncbi:ferrous iron transport protein B [Planctomycetales bacterium ZRK34]|nr:ferrous iron transport protein B [Planctomycetales bacterium ZRK34]